MGSTPAERKRAQRIRDKEQGIRQVNLRVHESDEKAVKKYAAALLEKKLKQLNKKPVK